MAQTNVPSGSALARKEFSAAIFAKTISAPSFDNNITGTSPKQSDAEAKLMARDIAIKIEQELKYPGEIKVTMIRETRIIEYAR